MKNELNQVHKTKRNDIFYDALRSPEIICTVAGHIDDPE